MWQVCSKDYTYIKVKVLSIPIRNIYMTAHYPDLVHELQKKNGELKRNDNYSCEAIGNIYNGNKT